ncbi:MAG: helix-turn-helix domain-containing protein [Candidatus Adiutrix sp.]|jgi:transcriptional regulator with XRE-family HTH domain|nr:helix-turn-helix domain-containing protein [Candidatus Adiutrix sp.]
MKPEACKYYLSLSKSPVKPGSALCLAQRSRRKTGCLVCGEALGPLPAPQPEAAAPAPPVNFSELLNLAGLHAEPAAEPAPEAVMDRAQVDAKRWALGKAITKARLDKGLTQKDLADLVGVKGGSVSNWEVGRGSPTYDAALKLDAALGLELVKNYGESLWNRPKNQPADPAQSPQEPAEPAPAEPDESPACEDVLAEADESLPVAPEAARPASPANCANCPPLAQLLEVSARMTEASIKFLADLEAEKTRRKLYAWDEYCPLIEDEINAFGSSLYLAMTKLDDKVHPRTLFEWDQAFDIFVAERRAKRGPL